MSKKGLDQYNEAKAFLLDYVDRNYNFDENEVKAYQRGMVDAFEWLNGRLKAHNK